MKSPPADPITTAGKRAQPYRPAERDPQVDLLTESHGHQAGAVLPVLQGLCDRQQPLERASLRAVAAATGTSDARVAGLASFYSLLNSDLPTSQTIRLCEGPACMALGADRVATSLAAAVGKDADWCMSRTSCLGICDRAPAALVGREPCGPLPAHRSHDLVCGWRGRRPDYSEPLVGEQRIVLGRLGQLQSDSLASALRAGAYRTLQQALLQSPEATLQRVEASGLRGRGGAGFPTGRKWRLVANASNRDKCVVCNADESEPGAFKDRILLESDPHLVLEGMALAGHAVGAAEGIIYVRGEYEAAAISLEQAILQAERGGWLGSAIGDSSFDFRVRVHRGAGAYICGEETALLESLEGRRGEPRLRPPYPTTHGYLGRPTLVNNVETLAAVPPILQHASDWYRQFGTPKSAGTKVFTLSGHVRRPAACEVALGVTARDLLQQIGLGMRSGSRFKMALAGGAAGTLVPESLLDLSIDFDSQQQGVALGSGVLMFFDESVSAVDLLGWLLRFFQYESCGKCTPCRIGTYRAYEILRRIAAKEGRPGDLAELEQLAEMLQETSLCGLGQSAAWPLTSALRYFREDFRQCGAA